MKYCNLKFGLIQGDRAHPAAVFNIKKQHLKPEYFYFSWSNTRTRFLNTLSVLPQSKAPKNQHNQIDEGKQTEVVAAFGDGTCASQRAGSVRFGIAQSSINKILK